MPKFKTNKVYLSDLGNLFMVDEKQKAFVVYKLVPVQVISKSGTVQEIKSIERFLEDTVCVNLDDNADQT